MSGIKGRIDKAVESILENERLTADLDDDAAKELLDWGISCAKKITQGTLGLNDLEAEEAMYQPMRATRRLMRSINKWVDRYEIMGDQVHAEMLAKIIELAGVIYGSDYIPPSSDQQQELLSKAPKSVAHIPQMISKLRSFVETDQSPDPLFT